MQEMMDQMMGGMTLWTIIGATLPPLTQRDSGSDNHMGLRIGEQRGALQQRYA
jgi:hypothetical protein